MIQFTNILYPINLDSKSHGTIVRAIEIAAENGGRLHFLYVNSDAAGYRYPTYYEDSVALKMKELAPPELIEKTQIIYAVSKGILGEKIKEYCIEHRIDLIIASHKHRGKLYSLLFDSRDENIIDTVSVPVLLFPRN